MTDKLEETAQQIADQGREALIARLRPAFQEAAAAHSDVLDLAPEQLDAMVERAVERADGLQWRRALASVATEQLGISLGEALGHPAVARAQELAGVPSYEESLAQLGPLPGAASKPAAESGGSQVTEADEAPAAAEADAPEDTEADGPQDEIEAPPGTGAEGTDEDEDDDEDDEPLEEPSPSAVRADDVAAAVSPSEQVAAAEEAESEPAGELESEPAAEPEPEPLADPVAEAEPEPFVDPVEDVAAVAPSLPFAEHDADAETQAAHDAGSGDEYEDGYPDEPELPPSTAEYETVRPFEDEDEYEEGADHALRVAVIHLGGIANLAPAERNIELQMSEDGLDIVRGGGEILGRLDWDQVKALEVPIPRGRRRMRRGASTHLIVRTARGDASFEVPEVSPPELQQHLAPIVARHVRGT